MWFVIVFLSTMGIAGLVYPRRPMLTAMLFVTLGASIAGVWAVGWISGSPRGIFFAAATWGGFGLAAIWKFRDPAVRAEHVRFWNSRT